MTDSSKTQSLTSTDADTAQEVTHAIDHALAAAADSDDVRDTAGAESPAGPRSPRKRLVAYGLLLVLTLAAVAGAAFTVWRDSTDQSAQTAGVAAVGAATETTIAMLSYTPENSSTDLPAAADRLAEPFRDQYAKLINEVVIPGSKEKQISAVASVPAAASVSATRDTAVVLLFVNQTITVGQDPSSSTASCIQVSLTKVADRWLISHFEPV